MLTKLGTKKLKGTMGTVLVLVTGLGLAQDALAFGSAARRSPDSIVVVDGPAPAQVVVAPSPVTTAPLAGVGDLNPEDYGQGYAIGQRNGGILVDRLIRATVGTELGCSALGDLRRALLKVTKKVSAPANGSAALTLGFFRGYLDALRKGIQQTQAGCGSFAIDDGAFAGELYGNVICSVTSLSLELASQLELVPLYDGWSGESTDVLASCSTQLELTVRECTGLDDLSLLGLQIQKSCDL